MDFAGYIVHFSKYTGKTYSVPNTLQNMQVKNHNGTQKFIIIISSSIIIIIFIIIISIIVTLPTRHRR